MGKQNEDNLDAEYKRYLEIMRPYLGQLQDQNVIEICNDWIEKLCQSNSKEKVLRNKYIFTLCYQLARGTLEEPFVSKPNFDELSPLPNNINHDESSTEMEYILVDLENTRALLNYEESTASITGVFSKNSNEMKQCHTESKSDNNNKSSLLNIPQSNLLLGDPQERSGGNVSFNVGNIFRNIYYQSRIKNLIYKLRNLKQQNIHLRDELTYIKENYILRDERDDSYGDILKIDASTSTYNPSTECLVTVKSLKCKLEEVQASRKMLIENINTLKNNLDDYDDMKRIEIEEIQAKYKIETMEIETRIKLELKEKYEQKISEIKNQYEESLNRRIEEIQSITASKDEIINKKIEEIALLNINYEKLKNNLAQISTTQQTDLEKYINDCRKSKNKYCKAYEEKIYNLKKEKQLTECFLQLQLMKQKAQITKEITDEYQIELTTALDKLENKYKDIIASVQATAVQRRFLDQMTLGSLIQTICGISKEKVHNRTQEQENFILDQYHNQMKKNKVVFSGATQRNVVGSVIVGTDSSDLTKYYTDKEKMVELFEKSHIPQKDVCDA